MKIYERIPINFSKIVREVAVVVVSTAIVVGGIRLFNKSRSPATEQRLPKLEAGSKFEGSAVGRRGLVVITTGGCTYCLQSRDFHKKLAKQVTDKGLWLRVLVDNQAASDSLLRELEVPKGSIGEWSTLTHSFVGTPTLALIDERGIVVAIWIGKVPEQTERKIEAWISSAEWPLADGSERLEGVKTFSSAEFRRLRDQGAARLIDVRERGSRTSRIDQALVIPLSEIGVRSVVEMAPDVIPVVDCTVITEGVCRRAVTLLQQAGLRAGAFGSGSTQTFCAMTPMNPESTRAR